MILVTGATGFVGREIVRQLHAAGYKMRLLVRDLKEAEPMAKRYGCELVKGNVVQPESVFLAMKGIEAVIHLVGIIAETPEMAFETAHIEGTRSVLIAMQRTGVKRYLHMSANGTRPQARSRYHQTKWTAEELVRESGLDWTIFRPSLIYGEHDQSINVMARVIRSPLRFFPNVGGGKSRVQPIPVEEVARCFVHAVGNPQTTRNLYVLCGPYSLLWREILTLIAKMEGKPYVFDELSILVILRLVVWKLTFILPIIILFVGLFGFYKLSLFFAVCWLVTGWLTWNWKSVLFFNIPFASLIWFEKAAEQFLPRHLQFGEQLKLFAEDNEGNPAKMIDTFGFQPIPFEEGLLREKTRANSAVQSERFTYAMETQTP